MAISARSMTTWPLVALPWDRKPALLLAAQAVPWADRQLKTKRCMKVKQRCDNNRVSCAQRGDHKREL
jgi:hypothetical protein